VQAVQRYVRPFRAMTAAPPPGPVVPATRQITRWLLTRPAALGDEEQAQLAGIVDRCPHLGVLAGHVRSFAEMMTRRQGGHELQGWLTQAVATVYRFRTRRRCCDLRFGRMSWLRQDRGSWLFVCST
jgi:hypothetical protein